GATPPEVIGGIFDSYEIEILVPQGSLDSYKNHSYWGQFSNISDGTMQPENPEEPGDEENIGLQFTKDGLTYEVISSNEVKIIGNDGSLSGTVVVPSSVDDEDGNVYSVTMIGKDSFAYCPSLAILDIHENIKGFEDGYLNGNEQNLVIIMRSTNPPAFADPYGGFPKGHWVLKIPMDAYSQYKERGWTGELQVIDINDPLPEGWEPVGPNDNNGILYEIIEGTQNVRVTGFEENGDSDYRELTIQSSVIIEGENYAVTEIGDNATLPFGVTNVILPETITYIGENFVSGTTGALNKITLGAKNPPMISRNIVGTFDIYYEGLWIVVPDDCVEAYEKNEYWSNFKRIVNQNDLPKYTITTSYENGKGVVTGYEGDLSGKLILPIYMSIAGYPQSITCINSDVFADCNNITSVDIPSTYKYIGTNAFKGCTGLTEVNISDLSAWCNICFDSNQSGPASECYDNPLYYAHKLTLNGEEIIDLIIPDGVTCINRSAFINCTNIKSVTIPKTVNRIEGHAFNGCTNLTDVNISDLSAWCNTYCESYYYNYILSHPLFSNANAKLKLNGEEIVDLVIPNDVTSINIGAFSCISSLKSVVISDSVTKVADYAFGNCSNLSELTIGSSVTSLNIDCFNGCNSLEVINVKPTTPPTISHYNYSGDIVYSFTDYSATVNVPMGCRDVYKQTEGWCNFSNIQGPGFTENGIKYEYISDTEVTIYTVDPSLSGEFIIPETANENLYKVVAIADRAFANCSAITSITIPESLTSIGSNVFEGCTALENVNWEAINCSYSGITAILPSTVKQVIFGDKVETITNYLCADLTSIESFIIPKSVNVIGVGAFANCYSMQTVEIPENVISIGDGAFHNTSIENVEWNAVNLYNNGMSFLPSSVRNINFGNDVVYIPMYACQGLTNLTSVVIPDAVEKIDVYAFEGCTSLSEVKIGKTVREIMYLSFGNCTSLENIVIPDALQNIDYAAFSGCSNLKNVTIGSGMQNIGEYAFDGCLRIEKVTVKATTAPTIANANAFTSDTYRFAELYVKYGYKSIYEKELFWRNFETISEESSPNHFEVAQSGMKASRGGKFSIPLNLINDNEIAGFQADIYLPSGFNVITTNDEYDITLSGRASASHSISYNVMSDGALRIIAYSTEAKAFEGNEGTLVNINIKIADNFNGSSKVEIKNVQMTSPDNTEYSSSDVEFSVTVQDPVLGNANGEAGVNVSDVIATANYVMGNSSTPVDLTNADINMDGEVNVVDVVGISNIVIGSTPNAMDVASAKNKGCQSMLPYSLSANNFFIENFEIYPGEEKVVEVVLNNNVAFTAFQADMYLPAGLNIKGNIELTSRKANHSLISSKQADGSTRILSYSATSRNFSGNDDAILTFRVVADESFKGDVLKIKDVIFSQQDMTSYKLNNTETKVWIAGVDDVMNDEIVDVTIINGEIFVKGAEDAQIAVYNVNGGLIYHGLNRPVAVANKGVYVVVVNGIAMKVML
ncbi:MAG: leucine-rich repeat protein, partial [Muribaculaceae bacterium]|nr:leucine-rich repeat protein [Muribaculaceae bacterium]